MLRQIVFAAYSVGAVPMNHAIDDFQIVVRQINLARSDLPTKVSK
jgi:hypothetical protein